MVRLGIFSIMQTFRSERLKVGSSIHCPICSTSLVLPQPIPAAIFLCYKCNTRFTVTERMWANLKFIDHYALLDIPSTAGADEIRRAARKKIIICHPDRNAGNIRATILTRLVIDARDILTNSRQRKLYDKLCRKHKKTLETRFRERLRRKNEKIFRKQQIRERRMLNKQRIIALFSAFLENRTIKEARSLEQRLLIQRQAIEWGKKTNS